MNNKKVYIVLLAVVFVGAVLYMFNRNSKNTEVEIDTGGDIDAEVNTVTERDINAEAEIGAKRYIDAEAEIDTEEDISTEVDIKYESYTEQVISDFLHMDSMEFLENYKKDDLYQRGILYCDKEAWKYDGSLIDAYQEDYYDVENITAIRFYKEQPVSIYLDMNIGEQPDKYEGEIYIDYKTDYAVSIYSKPKENNLPYIQEISFVKAELYVGTAPKDLYQFIENDYYEVRENLKNETWILSPDGEKAACVSNGMLPKHPSQIFIWHKDNKPLTVFRRTGANSIAGWIDNDHLVCYHNDWYPILVHLERNEIEEIAHEKCDFDKDSVRYKIQGSNLIAQSYFGEQLYQWVILEKDGEIYVAEPEYDRIAEGNRQYTYEEIEDGYRITLYDKAGNVVFSMDSPRLYINEITDDILDIVVSVGSPARYDFYFNKENAEMSDTYFNSILIDNKYVAYMESDEKLIITDIFNEGTLYKEIVRDFAKAAVPSMAIISIEMTNENSILLTYFKGKDLYEVSEIISLTLISV